MEMSTIRGALSAGIKGRATCLFPSIRSRLLHRLDVEHLPSHALVYIGDRSVTDLRLLWQ